MSHLDNFSKAHADVVNDANAVLQRLKRIKDAFAQKKASILEAWVEDRTRFADNTDANVRDGKVLKYGNHQTPGNNKNTHPQTWPFRLWTGAPYRIWFVRSGRKERVNDPVFGLLYLPDGRLFMPIGWYRNDSPEPVTRFVESIPSPIAAENLVHHEVFLTHTDEDFINLLGLCGINNAARVRLEGASGAYSDANITTKEEARYNDTDNDFAGFCDTTHKKGSSFQDILTGNCYCRCCSEGTLFPKRPAIRVIVDNALSHKTERIKRALQRYFVPTINPTARTYNYTISTQAFIKDHLSQFKTALKGLQANNAEDDDDGGQAPQDNADGAQALQDDEVLDTDDENDGDVAAEVATSDNWENLGFWELSEEKTVFSMRELAEALPNNVYKLLMEHNIDTAAFGMWTTASFLGTATHNALDLAYSIHEPPAVVTTRYQKTRSVAIDISRAYPGICTLAATAAYDFWINKILRKPSATATRPEPQNATTTTIKFTCVPSRIAPQLGEACLFPALTADDEGIIMRPDYVFSEIRCHETHSPPRLFERGQLQPLQAECTTTPLRAGQAARANAQPATLPRGKIGIAIEYKTRWGRLDMDKDTLFQYKLQALMQAHAINAGVAILHVTTVPYKSYTNHVFNKTFIADANNSFVRYLKTVTLQNKVPNEEFNTVLPDNIVTRTLTQEYFFVGQTYADRTDANTRRFKADRRTATLYHKATGASYVQASEAQLGELEAVMHKCLVTIE